MAAVVRDVRAVRVGGAQASVALDAGAKVSAGPDVNAFPGNGESGLARWDVAIVVEERTRVQYRGLAEVPKLVGLPRVVANSGAGLAGFKHYEARFQAPELIFGFLAHDTDFSGHHLVYAVEHAVELALQGARVLFEEVVAWLFDIVSAFVRVNSGGYRACGIEELSGLCFFGRHGGRLLIDMSEDFWRGNWWGGGVVRSVASGRLARGRVEPSRLRSRGLLEWLFNLNRRWLGRLR